MSSSTSRPDLKEKKIFVSTTCFPDGTPVGQCVHQLMSRGIYDIELGSTHSSPEDADYFPGDDPAVKFMVHNYFPQTFGADFVVNIASQNESLRNKSIEHILSAIEYCQQIGARAYTFHPGFIGNVSAPNTNSNNPSLRNWDFQFSGQEDINNFERRSALDLSIDSLLKIASHVRNSKVLLQVETEGSFSKKNRMIFDRPNDYKLFSQAGVFEYFSINLNFAHVSLASIAHQFNRDLYIRMISPRVTCCEMSHSENLMDSHLPVQETDWFLNYLVQNQFAAQNFIIEARNCSLDEIVESYDLVRAF